MSSPDRRATARVRPRLRRLAIVAFAVLLPVAAFSIWDYVEVRRLVAAIRAIEARDEPVTVRQAHPAPLDLDQNGQRAGRYYLAASMLCPPLPYETIGAVRAAAARSSAVPPELITRLHALVDEGSDALRLADTAATLPFGGFQSSTEYSYRTSGLLCLSELLSARTLTLSASDRGDEAVASALDVLKLRPALEDVPWTIAGRTDAGAILSLSQPSPAALVRLQNALEQQDDPHKWVDSLLTERAQVLEMLWNEEYGSSALTRVLYTRPNSGFAQFVVRPWFSHQFVRMLRAWDAFIAAARKPWPEAIDALAAVKRDYHLDERVPRGGFGRSITAIVTASYPSLALVQPQPIVIDRASRVALAVERFRRDHSDALPNTLNELIPEYLSAIPPDPFSGGPLLYARQPDAYIVYSVGPDKRDDRGEVGESEPRSASRAPGSAAAGADVGVRVVIRRD